MKIERVMDQSSMRGGGSEIDLESGGSTREDTGGEKPNLSGASSKKQLLNAWGSCMREQLPDASGKGRQSISSLDKASGFDESFVKNEKLPGGLKEQKAFLAEKKMAWELPKKPESTRPSKPPRHPRGPSLDAADMMLMKEISELAILKHKRIERMKTLHKVKKEKGSSMNSSLVAMVVTILFFVVIICQGLLGSHV